MSTAACQAGNRHLITVPTCRFRGGNSFSAKFLNLLLIPTSTRRRSQEVGGLAAAVVVNELRWPVQPDPLGVRSSLELHDQLGGYAATLFDLQSLALGPVTYFG